MWKSYSETKRTDKNSIMTIYTFLTNQIGLTLDATLESSLQTLISITLSGTLQNLGHQWYGPALHKISLAVGNLPLAHAFSNSRQGSVEFLYLILSSMHSLQTDSPRKVQLPHTN